jgi:hypothetical protein
MINKETAMALSIGTEIFHIFQCNADGTPQRWRVNGKCKTWKTAPKNFKVPVKRGLKEFAYLTQENNRELTTDFELNCGKCGESMLYNDSFHVAGINNILFCHKHKRGV